MDMAYVMMPCCCKTCSSSSSSPMFNIRLQGLGRSTHARFTHAGVCHLYVSSCSSTARWLTVTHARLAQVHECVFRPFWHV
jgi:hypothetical protein